MQSDLATDIATIQGISAVPKILESVAEMTGLGFVCVARVTNDSWHACAVLDKLSFGLKVGDALDVTTTLCEEVRDTGASIIIDHVCQSERYHDHQTPRTYGFQSYFSIPLFRPDGSYFGTLCGLDPMPRPLSRHATATSLHLFAELISHQLQSESMLAESRSALLDARETAELREQFIAVLGHDLRTPLGSILSGTEVLLLQGVGVASIPVVKRMQRSAHRIAALVDDLVDFTRGRMGGGIALNIRCEKSLQMTFQQVVSELRGVYPEREIVATFDPDMALLCDTGRMAQMLSNLLKNALLHGSANSPVYTTACVRDGIFELSVSNSGVPIPQEVMAQLFKPFWRASGKSAPEGLGLGLFIVSEIARSHGGAITVDSSVEATRFTYRVTTPGLRERRLKLRP